MRSFLQGCIPDRALIGSLNWDTYKRQIVSDLVDLLCADQERYLGAMIKLCYEVSKMNSFQHLEVLEGGKQKAEKARRAVAQLQQMMEIHEDVTREEAAIAERQRQYKEQLQKNAAIREKLQEILRRYTALAMGGDPHRRGLSSSQ